MDEWRRKMTMLVECGDHGKAPGSLVCIHLVDGTSHDWYGVPTGDAVTDGELDWLCGDCIRIEPAQQNMDHFVVTCLHCVHELQEGATLIMRPDDLKE